MTIINRFACYTFLLFFLIYACAQTSETEEGVLGTESESRSAITINDVENAVTELSNDPLIKHGQLALSIKSTHTGQSLMISIPTKVWSLPPI
jgi:hypothetical protein